MQLTGTLKFPGSAGILPAYNCEKHGKCGQDARAPREFELFAPELNISQ
jgi:hypothetical protein